MVVSMVLCCVCRSLFLSAFSFVSGGKSTFMNILAGLLSQDSGTVSLDGEPLAGRSLGVCLQSNDTLIPSLSPREHWQLYSAMRELAEDGSSERGLLEAGMRAAELDRTVADLGFGARRRLCVALALLG